MSGGQEFCSNLLELLSKTVLSLDDHVVSVRAVDSQGCQSFKRPAVGGDLIWPYQRKLGCVGVELDKPVVKYPECVMQLHSVRRCEGKDADPYPGELEGSQQVLQLIAHHRGTANVGQQALLTYQDVETAIPVSEDPLILDACLSTLVGIVRDLPEIDDGGKYCRRVIKRLQEPRYEGGFVDPEVPGTVKDRS